MTSAICRCIIRNIFSDLHPSFPSAYNSISFSIYILSCSVEPSETKRPFVQKSEWESSALELFKGLQTLLMTFKAVFLKALSKALRIHPLFKSTASSKFCSQRLNAKLLIHVTEPMSFLRIVLQCQRFMLPCQAHQLGNRCARSPPDHEHTDVSQSQNPSKRKCIFTVLNSDRKGLSSDSSTSYLPSQ